MSQSAIWRDSKVGRENEGIFKVKVLAAGQPEIRTKVGVSHILASITENIGASAKPSIGATVTPIPLWHQDFRVRGALEHGVVVP